MVKEIEVLKDEIKPLKAHKAKPRIKLLNLPCC